MRPSPKTAWAALEVGVDDFGARRGEVGYFWSRDLRADQPNANGVAAVFLSDDLLRISPEALKDVRVELTMIGGRIVHGTEWF